MSRIAGDPGVWRWLWFALGFRLPPENREWVRHELTDAGWRVRALVRQLVILVPVAAVFVALPGQWSVRIALAMLIVFGGMFIAAAYGDSLRASRLRQHRLPVPDDPDLGRPTDAS
jgi:Family of unknown function (DUF5313)